MEPRLPIDILYLIGLHLTPNVSVCAMSDLDFGTLYSFSCTSHALRVLLLPHLNKAILESPHEAFCSAFLSAQPGLLSHTLKILPVSTVKAHSDALIFHQYCVCGSAAYALSALRTLLLHGHRPGGWVVMSIVERDDSERIKIMLEIWGISCIPRLKPGLPVSEKMTALLKEFGWEPLNHKM